MPVGRHALVACGGTVLARARPGEFRELGVIVCQLNGTQAGQTVWESCRQKSVLPLDPLNCITCEDTS